METNEASALAMISTQMADAVERIGMSLVQVRGRTRGPATGIVVTNDTVLTADHVLERDDDLTIATPDGRILPAQLAGRDHASDLALLRIDNLGTTPATFVESPARVGQLILAVGRPGSSAMASFGIISATGGPLRGRRGAMLEQYVQTDAIPYPGFSGGALIDAEGKVAAVLTTGLINGVALGVPAALSWRIATTLGATGYIKRGFLGISSQPVELPEGQRGGQSQAQGLLIVRVEPGSPAAQGGLLLGDVLITFDGHPLTDTDELQALLVGERVGKQVPVQVLRGGSLFTALVTVGQRS
ncbi:trypsin-like peptidase domain-containing protein [Candidatus Chloroploca sp. M-50]|uniref:Trypsin-like peptidase domain-containing protein n=1 Tax=Candidatus Chloroploca mongolica TaxID=2528176 RepID=A0ABS4D8W2_9CHLR|nr:trypsin-like peptidase domain-containing protein [Candidatus Chloroploca mongolica]MBP1465866.1 trypsin-like peptidase domain-containing protein [Candidatus Chloroploca mongolica]